MPFIRYTNLPQFEVALDKFAKKMQVRTSLLIRKVSFDLYKGITERTPVDTGHARANWNISINVIDSSVLPVGTTTGEQSAALINAQKQLAITPDAVSDFATVWISNSLPYINKLEQGKTKQLGKGKGYMVQRTLHEVQFNLETEIGNL